MNQAVLAQHLNTAREYLAKEDFANAEPHLRVISENLPGNLQILSLLAHTYDQLKHYEGSARTYREIEAHLAGASPEYNFNFYICFTRSLIKIGAFEEALATLDRATERNVRHPSLLYNRGMALDYMGECALALQTYQEATEWLMGSDVELNRAIGMLKLKLFDPAAVLNETSLDMLFPRNHDFPVPRWRGEPLAGKSIYIWKEQGIGDVIMFAGFLPYMLKQGGKISIAVPPDVMPIYQRSFPDAEILPFTEEEKAKVGNTRPFDYHAPMGDMLHYCFSNYKPREVKGYLKADPERVNAARKKYEGLGPGKKIGISWHTINDNTGVLRNIPLQEWIPLLQTSNCHFISLQYGYMDEELAAFVKQSGCTIHNIMDCDPVKDREDFFAHIAACDAVISVQNSTVHIAGALGVETLIMLSKSGEYRWRTEGSECWWYPTVTIARQKKYREWQPVIQEAKTWLEKK